MPSSLTLPFPTALATPSLVKLGGEGFAPAVSGYPYPSDVNETGATGFHYHLTKPVNCDHLCSLLKGSRASEGDASTKV
jgi:hypothetical protein